MKGQGGRGAGEQGGRGEGLQILYRLVLAALAKHYLGSGERIEWRSNLLRHRMPPV